MAGLNKNNWEDGKYAGVDEKNILNGDIHRLRLAYDTLKDGSVQKITYTVPTEVGGNKLTGETSAIMTVLLRV